MNKGNLKFLLTEINQNISILKENIHGGCANPYEHALKKKISSLKKANKSLVKQLRDKEDENLALIKQVKILKEDLRVTKAKDRVQSVETSRIWDKSFEKLYNNKIKKYV